MDSGTFLFLGARVAEDEVDITGKSCGDLDRLYPLYEYVESAEENRGRALPVAASQRLGEQRFDTHGGIP